MHNIRTVISFEFFRTIKKKNFWLSVLAMPLIMSIVLGLSYTSGKSAEETEKKNNAEEFSVMILDESGLIKDNILEASKIRRATDKEEAIRQVKDGRLDSFIYYPQTPSSQTVEVYGQDDGLIKNGKYANLARQLLKSSIVSQFESPEEAAILQTEPKTKLTVYEAGEEAQGFEQVILPGFFLVLFYFVIILLGNHMLLSTTEEKENRVIEIILTSVDASSLIIGKIIAMILVGILQVTIISLPVLAALFIFPDKLSLPFSLAELAIDPYRLLIGAIIFIFSFLLFTGMLVTIGAVMPTMKEAGGFFGIAMFFMFIPLYSVMAIVSDPSQTIVKVFSFFPLTAPITLLLRNAIGNLTIPETIAGILILSISSILLLIMAIRAFRYGTLEYENKLSLKRIIRG